MSRDVKYIGMDVHKEAVVIAVLNRGGKLVISKTGFVSPMVCRSPMGFCIDPVIHTNSV